MAIERCKLCGKVKSIFKEGFCKECYSNKIEKLYLPKPNMPKIRVDSKDELIQEVIDNPRVDKKELAVKYGISIQRVYQILNRYFDIVYVERQRATIPNQIK